MQGGNMHTPSVFEIEGKPAHRKSPPRTRMTFDGKYQSIVDRILSRYYREQPQSLDEIALSPDAEMYCPLSLSMSNEKVGLVKEYPFEDFCLQHFQPRTSWGVKVPITELLSFSPVLINKPLTKLDPSLRKKATQAFKSTVYADITSYMKARNSSRNSLHHIIKVLKSAVDHLDLRDEVYCQLIKQTNNNPSKSALRAWKLFGVCAGVFAPSSQLRLPLLNHLVTIVENEEEAIAQRARYCANRIEKHFLNEVRFVLPEVQEIKHIRHMKPMSISIYFLTGAKLVIPVESYDTAQMVTRRVLQKIKVPIHKMPLFGLYEMCQTSNSFGKGYAEERFVWDCELVMDILTSRSVLSEDSVQRLILKQRLFLPLGKIDEEMINFTYAQASFDVLSGRVPVNMETSIQLAGLMLQIDLGDYKDSELISLDEVLSEQSMFQMSYREWTTTLRAEHRKSTGCTKQSCKQAYIHLVSTSNLFTCQHFAVHLLDIKGTSRLNLPKNLWLSISYQGFFLISNDTATVHLQFPYTEVMSWGVATDRFVLVTLYYSDQVEIHLGTKLGPVIQSLAEDYANLIAGRGLSSPTLPAKWLRREGIARTFLTIFPRLSKAIFK